MQERKENYILVVASAKLKKMSQETKWSTKFEGCKKVERKVNMRTQSSLHHERFEEMGRIGLFRRAASKSII